MNADRHWLNEALKNTQKSLDPATRVGSVIIAADGWTVVHGYNRFPHGIAELESRYADRDFKLKVVIHAEIDALFTLTRFGTSPKGANVYLACTDDSGEIWGGPPCTRCVVELIHAGVRRIVSFPQKKGPSKWHDDLAFSREMLKEAGVDFIELPV